MAKLRLGDQLPAFSLNDQHGVLQHSKDWIGAALVIYFYPNDHTRICTAQACSFRNHYDDFLNLEAKVVGISHNSVASHADFATEFKLPFPILSDTENKVRDLFAVPRGLLGLSSGRVTYIFDKTGKLVDMHHSDFKAREHVEKALEVLARSNE